MISLRTVSGVGRRSSLRVSPDYLSKISGNKQGVTNGLQRNISTSQVLASVRFAHQQQSTRSISSSEPLFKSSVAVENPSLVKHRKDSAQASFNNNDDNSSSTPVPKYLQEVYWWAYLHPNAIHVFERQWLVDAILWGNFNRLRDAALDELSDADGVIEGRTLQVACVYGNFTELLAERLASDATLDVVDVAPIQIQNLTNKLQKSPYAYDQSSIRLNRYNAADLQYSDDAFDQVIFFFLLHEMPEDVRIKALAEATRVLKKQGGKLVFVDYHRPTSLIHPHRYIMPVVLNTLEPFAMDLWNYEIQDWLPEDVMSSCRIKKELFFGGLYQKVVITRGQD